MILDIFAKMLYYSIVHFVLEYAYFGGFMDKKEFEALIIDAVNDKELKSTEIPAIDLYVDQIINLHTEKLKEGSERYTERQLTKTMINNYAKDRVITPVKGKKYTKEQIIQIFIIYALKSTLSIGEIKRMLEGAYAIDGFDAASLVSFYDKLCDIKAFGRESSVSEVENMLFENGLDIEKEEDFLVAIAGLGSMSAFMKNIAQAMIDERYPEPIEEEESEKDKDKEKKEKEKDKEKKEKEPKEKKEKEKKKKKSAEE